MTTFLSDRLSTGKPEPILTSRNNIKSRHMPKTKKTKKLNIKLTKAAEASIKKEAEAFEGLTLAKQVKAFQTACNVAEHSPEVALLVAVCIMI